MRVTGRLRALSLALALLLSVPGQAADADRELEQLMDWFWEEYQALHPVTASFFGADRYRAQLDDLGDESFARETALLDGLIEDLAAVDATALSDQHRIHRDAFEWMLLHAREQRNYKRRYLGFTTISAWHTGFVDVITAMPYRSEQDYRDLLQRMRAFSRYAEQNMALMKKGIETGYTQPCEVLGGYEEKITGYISAEPREGVFFQPFLERPDRLSPEHWDALQAEAESVILEVINPAYERYANFFVEQYRPACRPDIAISSVPDGAEMYDFLLRFFTSVDTDAETVHKLGLAEVKRINAEMQAILDELGFEGDLPAFFDFLRTDPRFYTDDETDYLRHIAWIAKRVDGKLPDLFARLPSSPFTIKPVPEQVAARAPTAYYQSGSPDGSRAGVFFANTHDLNTRPLYELPALTLHEAAPGHHLQTAFQQEAADMPEWRKIFNFTAYSEGWGLYSESLGYDIGVYTTAYERFGRLIFEMWRAGRLVVDTGIHRFGWTRQQSIEFLVDNVGLTRENIVAEVDRYITMPGQATAYKYGELKIQELRRRAEAALGENFSLRDFHMILLEDGSLPLAVLDAKVTRWIEQQSP